MHKVTAAFFTPVLPLQVLVVGAAEPMVEVAGTFPTIARGDYFNLPAFPTSANGKGLSKKAKGKAF